MKLAYSIALWVMAALPAAAQSTAVQPAEVRAQLQIPGANKLTPPPAVLWLEPSAGTTAPVFTLQSHYSLLQKNRTFYPHLQIVPVGAKVEFPNADPFFHNVFSLYNGKRFDLGLYEAGSSKSVEFQHAGVSYIFCNIHPEMSAVIISLKNPLYAVADKNEIFSIQNVPSGDYQVHLWIEGQRTTTDTLNQTIHVSGHTLDLGMLQPAYALRGTPRHTNKFNQPYPPESGQPYP